MSDQILKIDINDSIATLTMNRPDKRNAMCEELLEALDAFFSAPPKEVRVVILTGTAGHFCSGLDLSEHVHRSAEENLYHSRQWHQVMEKIQFGGLAVVSAMFGAVIGGGLELASSTHVRIAEPSTIFQLPEGRRGIFVGGGATARVGRLLGADRMTEMMLTVVGRVHALRDMRRLFVQQVGDFAGVPVELVLLITDIPDAGARDLVDAAHVFRQFVLIGQAHLAADHNTVGRGKGFARHARKRILIKERIQHRIGNLVGNFIGMSLGNGFGGKNGIVGHGLGYPLCLSARAPR